MSFTKATIQSLFDAMVTNALTLGQFERVNTHEPKSVPGSGLTCAIWFDSLAPAPSGSGLAATTIMIVADVRIYQNMLSEPQDAIDPAVLAATAALMESYSGDFTLGGLVQSVDLLGRYGTPMQAQAGYINQDGRMMRVMTITVPMIVNDAWTQTA